MARFKIELIRNECIGAAACMAVAPKFWELKEDGKVDLIEGKRNADNSLHERIIEADDFEIALESAQVCPVNVIRIINLDTGEVIHPKS